MRSAFFHKDRDGKLKAGPLWDYNFSLAVGGSTAQSSTVGWKFQARRNVNNWYPMLTAQASFMDMVTARWKALRAGLLSQAGAGRAHRRAHRAAHRRAHRARLRALAGRHRLRQLRPRARSPRPHVRRAGAGAARVHRRARGVDRQPARVGRSGSPDRFRDSRRRRRPVRRCACGCRPHRFRRAGCRRGRSARPGSRTPASRSA